MNNFNDIVFNLSQYLNDLNNGDSNLNKIVFIYNNNNQLIENLQDLEYKNRSKIIIEYLFNKVNNSLIKNSNKSINDLINVKDDQLSLKFEISYLTTLAKNSNETKFNIYVERAIKCLNLANLSLNKVDQDSKLNILILVKNLSKLMLNSNQNLDNLLLLNLTSLLSNFNEFLNCHVYVMNKYLKIIDLLIQSYKKYEISNLIDGLISFLIKNDNILRSIETKCSFNKTNLSIEYTVYNNSYIKFILIYLKSLFFIKNDLYNHIIELINDEKIDLIYSQGLDDDIMIDFNLNCLENQPNKQDYENSRKIYFNTKLNSHRLFYKLMSSISFDYEIIIEWLISNETNFLKYLVKYLKVLQKDLIFTNESLLERNIVDLSLNKTELDQILKLINNLNIKIKFMKRSFPYNCEPLIKLLEKI